VCPDVAGVKSDDAKINGCPAGKAPPAAVAPSAPVAPVKQAVVAKPLTPTPTPSAPAATPPPPTAPAAAPTPPPAAPKERVWYKPWTWFDF
jgi:hypothetical protein